MIKKLIKYKRAVSPVVSTMFLMGVILMGIAITLGFIYPELNKLSDNVEIGSISSSFISIDNDIKSLIQSGENAKVFKTLDLGTNAFLTADTSPFSTILFLYQVDNNQIQTLGTFDEDFDRLSARTELREDTVPQNSHSYLVGSGNQDIFYLNHTSSATMPWTILNQSRALNDFLNTSLSYRGIISFDKNVDIAASEVNLTISMQLIDFQFKGSPSVSSATPSISIEYDSVNVTRSEWYNIGYTAGSTTTFMMKINTFLDGKTTTEIPLKHEVPGFGTLNVQLEIISHVVIITL